MPDDCRARERPLVTVATVAHNAEEFISEAIESVLAQEFRDFELVICDDCSTDRTWEIIHGFADPRIRAVRNPRNIGEYPNRNQALALARGKYIIYIDGDDCLYPHGLGFMVKMLEAFPRAAFASAQEPSEKFVYPVELSPHDLYACLFFGPMVIGANFTQLMFRTAKLREVGGFDLRYRTNDTRIQFALGMHDNCVLISGGLAWWRRHGGQASEVWLRTGRGVAEVAHYGREMLQHPDCPLSAEEKRLAGVYAFRPVLRRIVHHLLDGHVADARELLRISRVTLREWPYLFAKWSRPFLADVGGANPIRTPLRASPLPAPVPRNTVYIKDRLGNARRLAKVVDRAPAIRNQAPVVQDNVAAH